MPARLAVRVSKRRRFLRGRVYEWVERRVLLPADFPDVREVIVMTVEEYEELLRSKNKIPPKLLDALETAIDLILKSERPWPRLKHRASQE